MFYVLISRIHSPGYISANKLEDSLSLSHVSVTSPHSKIGHSMPQKPGTWWQWCALSTPFYVVESTCDLVIWAWLNGTARGGGGARHCAFMGRHFCLPGILTRFIIGKCSSHLCVYYRILEILRWRSMYIHTYSMWMHYIIKVAGNRDGFIFLNI